MEVESERLGWCFREVVFIVIVEVFEDMVVVRDKRNRNFSVLDFL